MVFLLLSVRFGLGRHPAAPTGTGGLGWLCAALGRPWRHGRRPGSRVGPNGSGRLRGRCHAASSSRRLAAYRVAVLGVTPSRAAASTTVSPCDRSSAKSCTSSARVPRWLDGGAGQASPPPPHPTSTTRPARTGTRTRRATTRSHPATRHAGPPRAGPPVMGQRRASIRQRRDSHATPRKSDADDQAASGGT